jgi:hypothetical protein
MRGIVDWMGAQADEPGKGGRGLGELEGRSSPEKSGGKLPLNGLAEILPAHNFPAQPLPGQSPRAAEPGPGWDRSLDADPDIWLYRKKTFSLLRRYMQWSLAAGRVPSLLGRELFRARITAFTATTFETRVIFLHDMERCLDELEDFDRQIIARVCLQQYDHDAAARILHCTRKTIERRLPDLIDELSEVFLKAELLDRLPETKAEAL